MNQEDGFQISRALLLIGGIVAIAFGATVLGSMGSLAAINLSRLFSLTGPLMAIVVGVVALVTANRVKDEPISVVLAVLGFITGGAGGVLVAIAGISAIISKHTLKSS
jgi:hypothetical protein